MAKKGHFPTDLNKVGFTFYLFFNIPNPILSSKAL